MESEQRVNTDNVPDITSSTDQVESSGTMAGDCKESAEIVGSDERATTVQQTEQSAATKSADSTLAEAARVELTDAKTGDNDVGDAAQIGDIVASESIVEVATDRDGKDDSEPVAGTSVVENAGVPECTKVTTTQNVEQSAVLTYSEPAKSADESEECEAVEPVAQVIEDDDDEVELQEVPDDEEEMSENASEIATSDVEQVDEIPDDDSQESVDGEHDNEEEDDVYHVEGSQVDDEEEIRSADESHDDPDELEVMREGQEEYDSNEEVEEEDDVRDHEMEAEDQEDDDDDDVAVISDTSDEEGNDRDDEEEYEEEEDHEDQAVSDRDSDSNSERLYSEVECQSEVSEADEDDLMNDAIMSRPRSDSRKESDRRGTRREDKFRNAKVVKRHRVLDWRRRLKKRSFKWLNPVSGNPAMRNVFESDHVNLIISNVTSTAKKVQPTSTDSPSPYIPTNKSQSETVDSDSDTTTTTSNMQQINKISDCIKKSAQDDDDCHEIKQQDNNIQPNQPDGLEQVRKVDDNNKENIRSNEKDETSLPKINGSPPDVKTATRPADLHESKDVLDIDESDEMEIMEISDEPSDEISADNATIIETQNNEKSSTCDIKSMASLKEAVEYVGPAQQCAKVAVEKDIGPSEADTQCSDKETPQNKKQSYDDRNQHQSAEDLPKTNSPKQCADSIANTVSPTPIARPISTNSTQVPPPATLEPSSSSSSSSEATAKRPRTDSRSEDANTPDDLHPTKKLKSQLDSNFSTHDQILNEYIEKTSNNSVDEIQKHLGQLIVEIHTLNDMIKTKELEWNNLLHLKKVKEEICLRLTRKKQVMEIMSTKVGQSSAGDGNTTLLGSYMESFSSLPAETAIGNKLLLSNAIAAATSTTTCARAESTPLVAAKTSSFFAAAAVSTPTTPATSMSNVNVTAQLLNNLSNISAISVSGIGGGGDGVSSQQQQPQSLNNSSGSSSGNSIVQNILQNRANMKASDLNREKATTQRLHRNILPKPSATPTAFLPSSPPTAAPLNGDASSIHSIGQSLAGKYPSGLTATSLNAKTTISVVNSSAPVGSSALLPMNLTNSLASQKGAVVVGNEQQPILNNYLTTSALQKQISEMLNGHHAFRGGQDNCNNVTNGNQPLGVGRQGQFKDVRSIIADYRQKHPEAVPRRGRRVKSASSHGNQGDVTSNILGSVLKSDSKGSTDLGSLWHRMDGNSRPSSNDSSHSLTNAIASNMASGNVSFKDALIQFAKFNEQNSNERTSANLKSTNTAGPSSASNPPFPEVTLHPVTTAASSLEQGGSLLHGILTKFNRQNSSSATTSTLVPNSTTSSSTTTTTTTNYNSSFSPTLARLLTAPERITSATHSLLPSYHQQASSATGGNNSTSANQLNISKMVAGHNSEITITPVSAQQVPTLLQQQLIQQQHQQQQQLALKRERIKLESLLNVKDDDSIDRLVIDEGGDSSIGADDNPRIAPNACGLEFNENEVPACQGCKKNEAQFVCAGCANQLYCSRECQVAAWDEHSEVCTG